MTAYTVYLDQVFLGNMVMNYAILWAASKLSRVPVGKPGLPQEQRWGPAMQWLLYYPAAAFS